MKNNKIYEAAFSQIDITPDFQTTLIGYYRPDSRSQGVLHRLYAQAVLFKKDCDVFCIIAIDNLGLTVALSNKIRFKLSAMLKTHVSHVMLNFSHTHSAPEPTVHGLNGLQYFDFLFTQIIKCVENAMENLSPCKAGWACTTTEIGENRRDGCSANDNRLGAILIADAKTQRPMGLMTRVTAHANVLMGENACISSDYIGVARQEMAVLFGCPVMILQGAAGNIKPFGVDKINGGNTDDLHRVSNILVSAAKKLKFELQEIYDLQMFSREITFISDIPSREVTEKLGRDAPYIDSKDWLNACEELRNNGHSTQEFSSEISFFKLNEGCICGVAEEIFCEIAMKAVDITNNPLLFLNGYTNGCKGYLPNRDEWHKGGYEVLYSNLIYHKYHGNVMPYREETAEEIVKLVAKEWKQIKNQ